MTPTARFSLNFMKIIFMFFFFFHSRRDFFFFSFSLQCFSRHLIGFSGKKSGSMKKRMWKVFPHNEMCLWKNFFSSSLFHRFKLRSSHAMEKEEEIFYYVNWRKSEKLLTFPLYFFYLSFSLFLSRTKG